MNKHNLTPSEALEIACETAVDTSDRDLRHFHQIVEDGLRELGFVIIESEERYY